MSHGQHTRRRMGPGHPVALIVVVLLVLSSFGAVSWAVRSAGDGPTAADSGRTSSPGAAASQPSSRHTTAALRACQAVWQAQGDALDATEHALAQWRIHVGAMNKLVAGTITLAQAQAFWTRTRVGASTWVDKADAALAAYRTAAHRCGDGRARQSAATVASALAACRAAVRARDKTVDAGVVALSTWKHHIMDMEMLRAGRLSPTRATQMWLMNWHRGVRQLARFHHVRSEAPGAGGCR